MGVQPWVAHYHRDEAVTLYEALAVLPPDERTTLHQYLNLTPRQQQVAMLTARGMKRREIANMLCITEQTVGNHLLEVYTALDIPRTGNGHGQSRRMLVICLMRVGRALERVA